ncbi:uncharacterized protein LOC127861061 isoform X2 [Dreissena polymorpha]|uniref:Uncharacterized protein n=1 Tax=Dreissena polymorpha TaxID=45954 RepID=A0A9D4NHY1_DREPO|nr:uncharacterized protein LOC127861061 isoform X2 [Dreissena polymorpha]KAH3893839.1 hypothetical protein DPMN_017991 [Dreissena polymorpha]
MFATQFFLVLAITFANGKSLFPDFRQTSIELDQVKDMHRAFFPKRNSVAGDKGDGSVPWVCSPKECHVCWGAEPNKVCVFATSAPGRIHLKLQYNDTVTIVEGDITDVQEICRSYSVYSVCLIATEVDITRYQAHLYLSYGTAEVTTILNLGSITIPQADTAKDVLTMILGHNGDELFQ